MDNDRESLELQMDRLAREVLTLSRNTLLVNLRFLDMALSQFDLTPGPCRLATDGRQIWFSAPELLRSYREDRQVPVRDYLHMVLHCIFHHSFALTLVDRECWDLACDMATEAVINELALSCTVTEREKRQGGILEKVKAAVGHMTAEKIYRWLLDGALPRKTMEEWAGVFAGDCHDPWYERRTPEQDPQSGEAGGEGEGQDPQSGEAGGEGEEQDPQGEGSGDETQGQDSQGEESADAEGESSGDPHREQAEGGGSGSQEDSREEENPSGGGSTSSRDRPPEPRSGPQRRMSREEIMETWKDIAERMQVDLETRSRDRGDTAGTMIQNLRSVTREKYDYSAFLRKFSVLGEVMKINDDEFDQIFYTYGLNLFENMPLVEPLEYKEVLRVREFVIAIDTSGSVQGELVQRFLQKTYNILKQEENFFHRINLHIIQCDARVQEDARITSQEEFDTYIRSMRLRGFGGTDFRPVFSYVARLEQEGAFQHLKGLIYFTDGYGVFPEQMPHYPTAFVFVDEEDMIPEIPSWAIRLVLRPEEV